VATQEHVSETLRRAVSSDRVGHAYLFCGPRGVGKTTLARVLAMALNCSDRTAEGEPCGSCADCDRIWSGTTSLDVVEIDAATNRGVDDARELRQRAMYAPSEEGRFKVYIVDEAHMLTREAWNALLKVLEEPPPRVIFIFATTEPQKIEQTAAPIMSRCQRFDFRRLGVAEIVARLQEVLGLEGAGSEEEALRIIARKADGGMRDALSLADQVLALSEGTIDAGTVRKILGVVEEERYLELFDLLIGRDRGGLFGLVGALQDQGYDLVEFYHGVLESLRTLLRLRLEGEDAEIAAERREDWTARARHFEPAELVRMLGMAAELETSGSLRRTNQPRILLELLFLRFSYLDRTVAIEDLIRSLGGEGPAADAPPQGGGPEVPPVRPPSPAPTPSTPEPESSAPEPEPTSPEPTSAGPSGDASRGAPQARGNDGPPTSPTPSTTDLRQAWTRLLQTGEGMPPGLSPFLIAAQVEVVAGGLLVRLPPGPGEERLQEKTTRRAIEGVLSKATGEAVRLKVERIDVEAEAIDQRISRTKVKQGRLDDLLEQEPGLRPAVETLDLEMTD
jgi:DNA polymerase III subunit gamma/tau